MKYLLLIIPFFILNCSSPLVNNINSTSINTIGLSQTTKKTGVSLDVKINFKKFSTKVNSNGIPPKTVDDIQSAKLYLIISNGTNPLLSDNIKFTSDLISYPTGSSSKTYTFFNVPEGKYYVALELFSDISGLNNILEPIVYDSNVSGDTAFGMIEGKRGLTISTNYATVTVPTMSYSFSDNSSSFNLYPKLLNSVGASIGSTLLPQAGKSTLTGDIILQQ